MLLWASLPNNASPLLFAKLDIQDGLWGMVVPDDTGYNFAYSPQLDSSKPIMIGVVPSSL